MGDPPAQYSDQQLVQHSAQYTLTGSHQASLRSPMYHPLHTRLPCRRCRDPGKDFTPCSAFNVAAPKAAADPALAPLAAREHMLPRGVEHGFCLNS